MDVTTRTCNICSKTLSGQNIIMFYYHMKQHIIDYKHLFSQNDIETINKACNNTQLSYLGIRGFNICKICNHKATAKQTLISHMKIHLDTHKSSFSEEEIQIIKETHSYIRKIKKRSYKKVMDIIDIDIEDDDDEIEYEPAHAASSSAASAASAASSSAASAALAASVASAALAPVAFTFNIPAPTINTKNIINLPPLIHTKFGTGSSQNYYL